MEVHDSLLDLVGNTPLVRLDRIGRGLRCTLLAKLEQLNPGGSVKDRPAKAMIDAAEAEGRLRPGGTIVEPTSGNTGVGLAIVAARRGYRCVFTMPDKMSQEKISLLRAYGAEVIVCPTAVAPEHPESYYSVANRLEKEIPGAFQPNQYHNPANPASHVASTGPEIWRQTDGRVTHFVAGIGTGGTISGVGRSLKSFNPGVQIVGRRPRGLGLQRRDGPAVPRRGDRRGLLAHDLRRLGRRSGRDGERPRLVHDGPPRHPRRGHPRRRLDGHRGVGRPRGRSRPRARRRRRGARPRLRAGATCRSSTTTPGWPTTASSPSRVRRPPTSWATRTGTCPSWCTCTPRRPCARPSRSCRSTTCPRCRWCATSRRSWRPRSPGAVHDRDLMEAAFRDPANLDRVIGDVMGPPLPAMGSGESVEAAVTHARRGAGRPRPRRRCPGRDHHPLGRARVPRRHGAPGDRRRPSTWRPPASRPAPSTPASPPTRRRAPWSCRSRWRRPSPRRRSASTAATSTRGRATPPAPPSRRAWPRSRAPATGWPSPAGWPPSTPCCATSAPATGCCCRTTRTAAPTACSPGCTTAPGVGLDVADLTDLDAVAAALTPDDPGGRGGDADQPGAAHRRHRRRGGPGPRARRRGGRRQHLRHALPAAARSSWAPTWSCTRRRSTSAATPTWSAGSWPSTTTTGPSGSASCRTRRVPCRRRSTATSCCAA